MNAITNGVLTCGLIWLIVIIVSLLWLRHECNHAPIDPNEREEK